MNDQFYSYIPNPYPLCNKWTTLVETPRISVGDTDHVIKRLVMCGL